MATTAIRRRGGRACRVCGVGLDDDNEHRRGMIAFGQYWPAARSGSCVDCEADWRRILLTGDTMASVVRRRRIRDNRAALGRWTHPAAGNLHREGSAAAPLTIPEHPAGMVTCDDRAPLRPGPRPRPPARRG